MRAPFIFAATLLGCASHTQVRPDEMSAAAHRREAAAERARSGAELAQYDPTRAPPPDQASYDRFYPQMVYAPTNPTAGHLYAAERYRDHARAHEQAAAELEKFEEAECREFPPKTRAACPVLSAMQVEDLPTGVRLHLGPEMPVDATLAHMRCHLAWARSHGYAPTTTCPLYIRGTQIEQSGQFIDLVSEDPAVAKELQRLAHSEN